MSARRIFGSRVGDDVMRAVWKRSVPGLAVVAIIGVFINILRLTTPLFALQVFDRAVSSGNLQTLTMLTAITLVAVVTAALLAVVRRKMLMHWGGWIERGFGPRLFEIGLERNARTQLKSAEMRSSANLLADLGTVRSFLGGSGLIAWMDVVWAPVFMLVAFFISPALACVIAVAAVLAIMIGIINERGTRESRQATNRAKVDDRQWVASAEQNHDTVGSLSMGGNLAAFWSRSATERLNESLRVSTSQIYFSEALRLIARMLRIAVLAFGVWLVINQVITIGAVIAAAYLGRTAFTLVQQAMQKWREMMNARRAYARIRAAMQDNEASSPSIPRSDLLSLILDGVSFRYANQPKAVFSNISLTVAPGEALYVIGPSAAGKTTFSRLVVGLLKPRSGQVRLGDVNVHQLTQDAEGCHVGYLPQSIHLFRGTIRENIARMVQGDLALVIEAAKLAGVHDTVLHLPDGYDTVISEDEPLLSAGRRKGIAIARAYYGWPSLIVLDEPESHLDREGRAALISAIKAFKARGAIVIITTQSRNAVSRMANKMILFEGAKTRLLSTLEEIGKLRRQRGQESISPRISD